MYFSNYNNIKMNFQDELNIYQISIDIIFDSGR